MSKLELGVLVGFVIFGLSYTFKRPVEKPPLDPIALVWMLPWLGGLALISFLGQYGGIGMLPGVDRPAGRGGVQRRDLLPRRADGAAPRARVQAAFRQEEAEVAADPVLAEG